MRPLLYTLILNINSLVLFLPVLSLVFIHSFYFYNREIKEEKRDLSSVLRFFPTLKKSKMKENFKSVKKERSAFLFSAFLTLVKYHHLQGCSVFLHEPTSVSRPCSKPGRRRGGVKNRGNDKASQEIQSP